MDSRSHTHVTALANWERSCGNLPHHGIPKTDQQTPEKREASGSKSVALAKQHAGSKEKNETRCNVHASLLTRRSQPLFPPQRNRNAATASLDERSHLGRTVGSIGFPIGDWLIYGERFAPQRPLPGFENMPAKVPHERYQV